MVISFVGADADYCRADVTLVILVYVNAIGNNLFTDVTLMVSVFAFAYTDNH